MIALTPPDIDPAVRVANYFRTARGRSSWGVRAIDDPELILVVEGCFEYVTADAAITLGAGEVLLIEPGVPHTFRRTAGSVEGVISCIHFELLPNRRWNRQYTSTVAPRPVAYAGDSSAIYAMFRHLAEIFEGYGQFREARIHAVFKAIWLSLCEKWSESDTPHVSLRMREMMRFVRQHLGQPIGRRRIAEAFALTPEHVNYLFRQELGVTPTQFLHRERCLLAYKLIHQERLSVKQAALRVGFADPFHFSRVFKKILGVSPSRA